MHGVTMQRVAFIRKLWDDISLPLTASGSAIGDVYVNGWCGPDAFTYGPEVQMLVNYLFSEAKRQGMSHVEAETQASTLLRTLAEFSGIRRHGLHEISVSPEQAVGMGMMLFKMETEEFLPPVDSLYIHIPKEFFLLEEIAPMMESYCGSQMKQRQDGSEHVKELSDQAAAMVNRFRTKPTDVAVSLTKNGPCLMANLLSCGINTHLIFNHTETMEQTLGKSDSLSDLDRVLVRVALSAALLATLTPKDLVPMDLEPKQRRERDTLVSKIPMTTFVHPTYMIFQKSLKTLNREPHEPTGRTREHSGERHVRPHFVHGHWRNQRHGPGWSLRRLRYIRPQIRYRHAFLGRPEDVVTEIKLEA